MIGEIASMHDGLIPDLSLGSHFFHEMVETGMLYLAVFPGKEGYKLDETFFAENENLLTDLLDGTQAWAPIIKVLDRRNGVGQGEWRVLADAMQQTALLHRSVS